MTQTCDTWHVTQDTWHVTHDGWREVNLISKIQLPRSYSLGLKMFWRYFHNDLINELVNDKGVCRTVPATQGLVKIWCCPLEFILKDIRSHLSVSALWNQKVCRAFLRKIHLCKVLSTYPMVKQKKSFDTIRSICFGGQ